MPLPQKSSAGWIPQISFYKNRPLHNAVAAVHTPGKVPGHTSEILIDKGNGKYQLDLWKANEIVLLDAGVMKDHLEVTDVCTCCNPELLFSHRASHGKRGNLGAFLCLNP